MALPHKDRIAFRGAIEAITMRKSRKRRSIQANETQIVDEVTDPKAEEKSFGCEKGEKPAKGTRAGRFAAR